MKPENIAADLVERNFTHSEPNQLWVTDITEHKTREGKVYCWAVLDVYSRRVVGWSIDSSPTAALATNALGMAIDSRLGGDTTSEPRSTPIRASSSPPGHSPSARRTPDWCPRWGRWATATTVR